MRAISCVVPDSRDAILITGAAGYIGSHATLRFLREGRRVVALDDLSVGRPGAIEAIRGAAPGADLEFVRRGITEVDASWIRGRGIGAVLHFAARAIVPESVARPELYYTVNTAGSVALMRACLEGGARRFVLSSTAATYGVPPADQIPIRESTRQDPINPYGRSKLAAEWALRDLTAASAGSGFASAALRYFNVAGCDRTGVLGEDHDPETHLIPILLHHVLGRVDRVTMYGEDYDTPDGSCIRDYIHVDDLVEAHAAVLAGLGDGEFRAYNLGRGRGSSVREVIAAVERVTGHACRVEVGPRRAGDPPVLVTDPGLIDRELGWSPSVPTIEEIVGSAWAWFRNHPEGYRR
jgi:UDP-glucose 4-epimerase